MAVTGYCGGFCGLEEKCKSCRLDQIIPCSPECENLQGDMILIGKCLEAGCEEVKYIFFARDDVTDDQVLSEYGEVAPYPYEI